MNQDFLAVAALAWYDAGCSVWPPAQDGTKRPMGEWKRFMTSRAPREMIEGFYASGRHQGVGIICGKISGNLEMLELEAEATDGPSLDAIYHEAQKRGVDGLLWKLIYEGYSEWTPSGGLHFLYRLIGDPVPGNTKIARRPATAEELASNPDHKIVTLSETRGEGGYVVVAPSGGTVHPSGDAWTTYNGRIGFIPTIGWDERNLLHEAITAALDQMPSEPQFVRPTAPRSTPLDATRPGDDFMMKNDWRDILQPHGWRIHHVTNAETFWTRPGKKRSEGWSATTGFAGNGLDDRLYVWSSSTIFDAQRPYNKFSAYCLLEHNGDFAAAARALAAKGYGSSRTAVGMAPPVAPTPPVEVPAPVCETPMVSSPPPVRRRDKEGIPIIDSEFFDSFEWDNDIDITVAFAEAHADTLKCITREKSWMFWDGSRWKPDDHSRHQLAGARFIAGMMRHAKAVARVDDVAGKFKVKTATRLSSLTMTNALPRAALSQPSIAAAAKDFDQDPHLVTCDNGILDLKTMELGPHDPGKLLTKKINARYDPSLTEGRFTRFIEEVLPDPQVRDYFQRAMGYAITGEADQRAIFLLHGESGTGKTQTLEALSEVLGDFAATAAGSAFKPRQEGYKGPSEDLHKLKGKRFVIQSELDQGTMLNEGLIKAITGADTQTTRDLYRTSEEWRPEYVVFMATNFLPRISSSDNAIWKRFKPIKFEQVFIDEGGMPKDPDSANLGRKMAQSEPEVILNWILEGLHKYRERGLVAPKQIESWLSSYRDETDTVRQFITEGGEEGRVTVGDGLECGSRELYNAYNAWCLDNHLRPLGSTNFRQRMESNSWKRGRNSRGQRWFGLALTGFIGQAQTPGQPWRPGYLRE